MLFICVDFTKYIVYGKWYKNFEELYIMCCFNVFVFADVNINSKEKEKRKFCVECEDIIKEASDLLV